MIEVFVWDTESSMPSSVCLQFRLSGTMLSNAISISASADIGIVVLVDREAAGRVLDKQMQNPNRCLLKTLRDVPRDLVGDEVASFGPSS